MFGRTVLRVEPRLDGLKVVSAKPPHSDWLGKTFRWSQVQFLGARVMVVDETGAPLRAAGPGSPALWVWLAHESMDRTSRRARDRAILQSIESGTLNREFKFRTLWEARIFFAIACAATLFAIAGAVLAIFGLSLFHLSRPPTTLLERSIDLAAFIMLGFFPLLIAIVTSRLAFPDIRALRIQSHQLTFTLLDRREVVVPVSEVRMITETLWGRRVVTHNARSYLIPQSPALLSLLDALASRVEPGRKERERRRAGRFLLRMAALWVPLCLGVGLVVYLTGGPPQKLVANDLLNTLLAMLPAFGVLPLVAFIYIMCNGGQQSLTQWLDRRSRAKRRRKRLVTLAL